MIVEICANSFASAKAAQDGGAHRIELCRDLSVGGLTPEYDILEKVISELNIPVHVLIRPRSGDFCYSESETSQMLSDINHYVKLGCAGIVSGVLTSGGLIDTENTKRLIDASKEVEFTFHRAFDVSKGDPIMDLETLQQLGVSRLLSSGKQHQAADGLPLLQELLALSEETIEIMPGSGIHQDNVLSFKNTGFSMVHLSATSNKSKNESSSFFDTGSESTSDVQIIREVIKRLS